MDKDLGNNRLWFKVGDIIKVTGRYGVSFITIDEIKEFVGVIYYYDHANHQAVNEPINETDAKLELADDNDETYKRYKLYLELKKEFDEWYQIKNLNWI